jgi:tRNA1Val (adenine37-N6)-methyltransferase
MDLGLPNLSYDTKEMSEINLFKFKYFEIEQINSVFKVGTDALVLGAWINPTNEIRNILDIGTGTGVLSLMMAQKMPNAEINSIDTNPEAVVLAQSNFRRNQIGGVCSSQLADFYYFEENKKYDLIISNPPYFLDSAPPVNAILEKAKHLSTVDLQQFFHKCASILSQTGTLCMIFPTDTRFLIYAEKTNLYPKKILEVYGKPGLLKRLCVEFTLHKIEVERESLIIRDENGAYTEAYKLFTTEFHGKEL